ncbi:MAG: amidohydrolase [Anaerolineaceae bacterium]|nr:amidohydrolase [Anaerolineaceae bacterium]
MMNTDTAPDILIENGRMLTPAGWSEKGFLTIKDGKISEIGIGPAPVEKRRMPKQVLSAKGMAVLPGLVNAHTHLSQTFMRGLSAGRPLQRWLKELIWPLQDAMSLDELRLAAQLGIVENLHSGVTHVVDHQKISRSQDFSLVVCSAAEQFGIRLTLAHAWTDKGAIAQDSERILGELKNLFECLRGNPMIKISSGPLTPMRATALTLQRAHALAKAYGSGTHIHVSETQDEVKSTLEETGMRPIAWLDSLGVLEADTQIVHAVWLDHDEIRLIKERGSAIVHCPVSNAVLGSGIAPIHEMQQAGIPIFLGTDGPASNDNQDSFENMKMAVCVARLRSLDASHLAPAEVLHMATGGKTLQNGDPADVILVNLRNFNAAPVLDIDSALALCCKGSDVDSVIVNGKLVMHQKRIPGINEAALIKECEQAAKSLLKRTRFPAG